MWDLIVISNDNLANRGKKKVDNRILILTLQERKKDLLHIDLIK